MTTLSDNYLTMSSDEQEIPVAAASADSEDKDAQPVPVKPIKVSETAWKCDYGGKTYHFQLKMSLAPFAISVSSMHITCEGTL